MNSTWITDAAVRPFLTRHALQRCLEMGVSRGEVVATLLDYESRYPSDPKYGPNRFVTVGPRLAVVHTDSLEVITVLWKGREGRLVAA